MMGLSIRMPRLRNWKRRYLSWIFKILTKKLTLNWHSIFKLRFKRSFFQPKMAIFSATVLPVSTPLGWALPMNVTSEEQKKKNICWNFFQLLMCLIWLSIRMELSMRVLRIKTWKQKNLSWSAKIITKQLEYNWWIPCKLSFKRGIFQTHISISSTTDLRNN